MEWLTVHATDLWLIVTTTVTLASLITKLTPTDKDDAFLTRVMAFLALNKAK